MENSKIEWCDHTFNPWIGCTKVSDGCKHCYAEAMMDKRWGKVQWGPTGTRQRTSAAIWCKPFQWNRQAEQQGRRYRVFCASLADVFEENPQVSEWRVDLFRLIQQTPHLDWLLLTKRPERIVYEITKFMPCVLPNIWIGTSVENQEAADSRIPELLKVPAKVRFLSMEPFLGPVDLGWSLYPDFAADDPRHFPKRNGVEWVIVGGESGPKARPMSIEWVRNIRDSCKAASVPFFFKQGSAANWGNYKDFGHVIEDLRIREFPEDVQ